MNLIVQIISGSCTGAVIYLVLWYVIIYRRAKKRKSEKTKQALITYRKFLDTFPTLKAILDTLKKERPCCDSPSKNKCEQCQEVGLADPKNQG